MATPQKIPCNISVTERQLEFLTREAKRCQTSIQDVVRRLLDRWLEETGEQFFRAA